jgi:hypothetical protein
MFLGVDVNLIATLNTEILLRPLHLAGRLRIRVTTQLYGYAPIVHRRSAGSSNHLRRDVRTPV